MVNNPPANAGDMSSIPDSGGSHMLQSNQSCASQLLSLYSRARDAQLLKPTYPRAHAQQEAEKPSMRSPHTTTLELTPLATTREKAHTAMKTQHSQYIYI